MAIINFTYALKKFYPELHALEVEAACVKEMVHSLENHYPGLKNFLLDDQGSLRQHVNIFVDGNLIKDRNSLLDKINPQSEVYIMQALSGG